EDGIRDLTVTGVQTCALPILIGPGGKVIKDIIARTGATIDIEDDGSVAIASPNSEGVEQAIKMIRALTQEAEVGKTYLGTVRRRSEERRVGKEGRTGRWEEQE